jgi:hypothetical protein
MAYSFTNSKGNMFYLHVKVVTSKNGKERKLFFFSRELKEGAQDALPPGYTVIEMKTGLPVLKKV